MLFFILYLVYSCNSMSNKECDYNVLNHKQLLIESIKYNHIESDTEIIFDERNNYCGGVYRFNLNGALKDYTYFNDGSTYRYKEFKDDKNKFNKIDNPIVFYKFIGYKKEISIVIKYFLLNKKLKNLTLFKDGKIKEIRYFIDSTQTNMYYSEVLLTGYDSSNIDKIDLRVRADIEYCDGTLEHIDEKLKCIK